MGSFCSKTHHGHFNQTEMTENTDIAEESDSTVPVNGDESKVTSPELDVSPSKVVPSYSWLVASPVDLDATAKKPNGKSKQSTQSRSGKTSGTFYNGEFVKYLCQPSAAELAKKQSRKRHLESPSSSSTGHHTMVKKRP